MPSTAPPRKGVIAFYRQGWAAEAEPTTGNQTSERVVPLRPALPRTSSQGQVAPSTSCDGAARKVVSLTVVQLGVNRDNAAGEPSRASSL